MHEDNEERAALLRRLLGSVGDGVVIKPIFRCDYGSNIRIGAGTFVNYDCVMLDVATITVGAACQIATRVQLLTAAHPIDPIARRVAGSTPDASPSATTSGWAVGPSWAQA